MLPLSTHEDAPGVLWSVLGPPGLQRFRHSRKSPKKANKMLKGLEQLCCEERLKDLGIFSLKEIRAGGDSVNVCKYLKRGCKEQSQTLSTDAKFQGKRQWAQTGTREVLSNSWSTLLCCGSGRALVQVAQGGCGFFSLEIMKAVILLLLPSISTHLYILTTTLWVRTEIHS